MEQEFLGAIEDPRSEEEKAKDYPSQEILGMGALNWEEKSISDLTRLTPRNQMYQFSCGGHAGAKGFESFTGLVMSAHPIYRRRSNYPKGGMYQQEIGSILKNFGTTLEVEDPSNLLTEEQINQDITVETPYKIGGYYFMTAGVGLDIDTIATALESGHPVIFGVASRWEDYKEVPIVGDDNTTFRHFVTALPKNYFIYKGEKAVLIEDSAGIDTTINKGGQRIFTESFLKKRSWGAMGLIPRTLSIEVPKYHFTRNLRMGYFGEDVKKLQECLAYLGYFPKTQAYTGFFGSITKQAVMKCQEANKEKILIPAGLSTPTGNVGLYTRNYLNALFNR